MPLIKKNSCFQKPLPQSNNLKTLTISSKLSFDVPCLSIIKSKNWFTSKPLLKKITYLFLKKIGQLYG